MVCLRNARVAQEGSFVTASIWMEDGIIQRILPNSEAKDGIDCGNRRIVSGLWDIHTHGAVGVDANAADADGLVRIGRFLASHGVTGWLASIMTDTEETTLACIEAVKTAMRRSDGAKLMGAHLEGPFLNPSRKGAMAEELLRKGDSKLLGRYLQAGEGCIRMVTVAPEVEGVSKLIEAYSDQVVFCLGHSDATYREAAHAVSLGAKSVTHCGNAMRLFHQHEAGLLGAALEQDLYVETILDGRHLHPDSVRVLLHVKGNERVIAVSDAIMATGLGDGTFMLGVNPIVVKDGDARLLDGSARAGSTLTLDVALRNVQRFTDQPLLKVLPLFTENPARLLGQQHRYGKLSEGYAADLIVLDADDTIYQTYVSGTLVYQKEDP